MAQVFVGEALVGNDGVDQLKMFNQVAAPLLLLHVICMIPLQWLRDLSQKEKPRLIDGANAIQCVVLTRMALQALSCPNGTPLMTRCALAWSCSESAVARGAKVYACWVLRLGQLSVWCTQLAPPSCL